MPSLYPSMVAPEDFKPGDCVRKWVNAWNVTPFVGVVTHIVPAAYKVWVQWPIEHSSESPESLIKVNPYVYGLPSATKDRGYDSYEKSLSERLYGRIPKSASELDKMAIRIAHTFATDVVGKLVGDIITHRENKLTAAQTYNRIYSKYASICSDYIMRSSIKKIYEEVKKEALFGWPKKKPVVPTEKPADPGQKAKQEKFPNGLTLSYLFNEENKSYDTAILRGSDFVQIPKVFDIPEGQTDYRDEMQLKKLRDEIKMLSKEEADRLPKAGHKGDVIRR
jgi:Fe-S cluster biosynthesis and repair protein YggX